VPIIPPVATAVPSPGQDLRISVVGGGDIAPGRMSFTAMTNGYFPLGAAATERGWTRPGSCPAGAWRRSPRAPL